jgi:colicin import membrane protein
MSSIDTTSRERTISRALALLMHLLFFVLLIVGVSWQKKQSAPAVTVELWDNLPPTPQPKVEPPPAPEVKPPPEPPKPEPKVEVKPEPKPEIKPAPKPDIALKEKLEKERKLKEQEKLEKERKQREQEKFEAKRREDEKKRQALKEKQAKEAEAKRLAKEQDDALKQLAQQQAAQAAAQAKLMDAYMNGIRERIKRYVVIPPNMPGNPEAEFEVVQIPGGEVLSVKLKRSSGVPAYDNAVERAILKAQPLPPPPAGVAFRDIRELNLKFRPKE